MGYVTTMPNLSEETKYDQQTSIVTSKVPTYLNLLSLQPSVSRKHRGLAAEKH